MNKDKITELPVHLLMALANAVCMKHGFPRIMTTEGEKLYRMRTPLPIIRENARGLLWVDRNYIAIQIGNGDVRYLYVNRTHINEERAAYREASKERGLVVSLPSDIDGQFTAAMERMSATKENIFLSKDAEAYGLSWVHGFRTKHKRKTNKEATA